MRREHACPGCGAGFMPAPGPTHAYLSASPECWACFNESMALHYADVAFWSAHDMLVDAYALQHSRGPDLRARRSAVLHLVALYAQCELGLAHDRIIALRRSVAAEGIDDELSPWPMASVVISMVATGDGPEAHLASVEEFGTGVSRDWREHHAFAGSLCQRFLSL